MPGNIIKTNLKNNSNLNAEEYLDPCQTPKMEFFAKIDISFNLLTISAKTSILDV